MRAFALTFAALLCAAPAAAQQNRTAAAPDGGLEGPPSQIAQVGAGVTNGSTTGYSGPDTGGGGEPPPPSPELCEGYGETARTWCLSVIMGVPPAGGEMQ